MRQEAGNLHEVGHDLHGRSSMAWLVMLQMQELQQAQGSSTSPFCTPQSQA